MPTIEQQKKRKLCQVKHQEKVRASKEAKTQGSKLSQTDTVALDDIVKKKEVAQNKKGKLIEFILLDRISQTLKKRKLLLSKPIMLTQRNGGIILGKHLMLIGRKKMLLTSMPIMLTQRNGRLILGKHLMLIQKKESCF